MSSVKKTEKSRKAKATSARAALKSRTTATAGKARKPSAAKARPVRAKARTAAAATRAVTKTKTARKPASTSSKSAAVKLRAAQTRAKKQAAAVKAARPAAKSSTAKSAAAARKTKANQTAAATKLKRSTTLSRGKSRAGRSAPVEAKLRKAVAAVQQPAVPQTEPKAVVKKVDSERRAQVAAVLALRSLRKPTPAAAPVARPEEASKASVTHKAPKKAAEAAPAPTRVAAHVAPKAVAPSAPEPAAKPLPTAEAKPGAPVVEKPKPAVPVKHSFKPLEFVVYPAHGVGQILAVEEQEVAGFKLELFVISFSKDKMILKVPTPKSIAVGMRKLAGPEVVKQALNTLTGRARIKRTMWSRRAQEYEAKINSGDLVAIAEVVRDLYRSEAQPEQSYSERQLYEAALDRVAREIAAVQKLTETEALKVIDTQLQKSPRRGKADEAEADAEAEVGEDGGIDEAA